MTQLGILFIAGSVVALIGIIWLLVSEKKQKKKESQSWESLKNLI